MDKLEFQLPTRESVRLATERENSHKWVDDRRYKYSESVIQHGFPGRKTGNHIAGLATMKVLFLHMYITD